MPSRFRPFLLRCCLVLMCAFAMASPAAAVMPASLNYDGTLYTSTGKPLATGRYDFKFALYTTEAGGTPIWTETHSKVQVNNGEFHVVLGKGNPAHGLDVAFDQQYWLGVSVDLEPELTPRVELMPTPYSFHSRLAQQVADGAVTGAKLAPEAVTDDKIKSVSWSKITGVNGTPGVPSAVWSLKGNSNSSPGTDFLGTTDGADLQFRTNNQPRFTIRNSGEGDFLSDFLANGVFVSRPTLASGAFLFGDRSVGIERPNFTSNLRMFGPAAGSFLIDGGNVGIGTPMPMRKLDVNGDAHVATDLTVDRLARLGEGRVDGALTVEGLTRLTNTTSSAGPGSGALVVSGGAGIGENLNVQREAHVRGPATVGGTLGVSGATTLERTLDVVGPATFADTTESASVNTGALVVTGGLGVGAKVNVGGDMLVFGVPTFKKELKAEGGGRFAQMAVDGPLSAGGDITGGSNLTVTGAASAKKVTVGSDGLLVNSPSRFVGEVTVRAAVTGEKNEVAAYPLKVVGSAQGILIEVGDGGSGIPSKSNNFISFRDGTTHKEHGRISGLTKDENESDDEYIWQAASLGTDVAIAALDVGTAAANIIAAAASATACVGLGACVTTPIPSLIVASVVEGVTAALGAGKAAGDLTSWVELQKKLTNGGGVTYSSGAADYAEWLPKQDPNEKILPGDIVGVRHGRVSRMTDGADMLMVASTRPLVLGNTPPEGHESEYVKVAFMGQVPLKVLGEVGMGDYLLPSGQANGYGIAKRAEQISARDLRRIVGVAWSASDGAGMGFVNAAVGLDRSGAAVLLERQEQKALAQANQISDLQRQLERTNAALAKLVPGFDTEVGGSRSASWTAAELAPVAAPALGVPPMAAPLTTPPTSPVTSALTTVAPTTGPIVSRADVEMGLQRVLENLRRTGATPENNMLMRQLLDPSYAERLREQIQTSLNGTLGGAR